MNTHFENLKKILSTPSGPQPVLKLFEALNDNPQCGEPIRLLAEYFRDKGKYEVASVLSDLYLSYKNDINYNLYATDIDRSIIGFYLPDNRKNTGKEACDSLSLNPSIDGSTRGMARSNLSWYASNINELISDIQYKQINLGNQDGYICLNPSIAKWRGKLWMIQRTVNYELTSNGQYIPVVDTDIRTKNWLCELDDDLNIVNSYLINHPVDWPEPKFGLVLGFEDSRLFVHNDELWTSSTVRELSERGMAQIVLAKIDMTDISNVRYCDWHPITPTHTSVVHYEKNWMPIEDQQIMSWVYSSDPLRIVDDQGQTIRITNNWVKADHWRGGSQVIPWKGGWLYIIHETIIPADYKSRKYIHRFVYCDKNWKISKMSDVIWFKTHGIEFVAGVTSYNGRLLVSFGNKDCESWIASINEELLWNIMKPVHDPVEILMDDGKEFSDQWNGTVLKNTDQVAVARNILGDAKLPMHHDTPKNWDNVVALVNCLEVCRKTEPVLDVGATLESAFLPGLLRCGYTTLVSLNLSQAQDTLIDGVLYRNGDITKTDYPTGYFGYVACLSVIEHGIDQEKFFSEVSRITRKGGRLCISTDYWSSAIDTSGIRMFDADMVVFTPTDITNMISIAEKYGFKLTKNFDPTSETAVIHNLNVDYTFAVLVFEKE